MEKLDPAEICARIGYMSDEVLLIASELKQIIKYCNYKSVIVISSESDGITSGDTQAQIVKIRIITPNIKLTWTEIFAKFPNIKYLEIDGNINCEFIIDAQCANIDGMKIQKCRIDCSIINQIFHVYRTFNVDINHYDIDIIYIMRRKTLEPE